MSKKLMGGGGCPYFLDGNVIPHYLINNGGCPHLFQPADAPKRSYIIF